jgi:hypothetical protein
LRESFKAVGVTPRAVILGLLCISLLCFATPYAILVLVSSDIAAAHLPIGVLLLFLILIGGVNTLLARLRPRWALTARELLVVYVMMLVPAGIPGTGFMIYLLPMLTGAYYLASPENKLSTLIHPYLKPWLVVSDPQAVKWFWEGLPPGQSIPWHAWLPALFWWTVFAVAFALAMASLAMLVRRQWIEEERLVFPLASIPLQIVGPLEERPTAAAGFFRDPWLWLGFAPVLLFRIINNLYLYLPAMPHWRTVIPMWTRQFSGPFSEMKFPNIFIYPSVIGLGYLLSAEVGLSVWLFRVLNDLQRLIIGIYGLSAAGGPHGWNTVDFFSNQEVGAFLMMGTFLMWSALRRTRKVLASRSEGNAGEAAQLKWALIGLGAGTLGLVVWSMAAGMSLTIVVPALALFYLIMIVLARIVASAGLFFLDLPFTTSNVLVQNLGMRLVSPASLTVFYLQQAVVTWNVTICQLPLLTDGLKIGHAAKIRPAPMLAAIAASFLLAIGLSYVAGLTMLYHKGVLHAGILQNTPQLLFAKFLKNDLQSMPSLNTFALRYVFVGAGVMMFLIQMNRSFLWWRLSPIGYLMAHEMTLHRISPCIFIGWAISGLVRRYGGLRLYRKLRPAFLGMILGEFASVAFWLVVDGIFGVSGHDLIAAP